MAFSRDTSSLWLSAQCRTRVSLRNKRWPWEIGSKNMLNISTVKGTVTWGSKMVFVESKTTEGNGLWGSLLVVWCQMSVNHCCQEKSKYVKPANYEYWCLTLWGPIWNTVDIPGHPCQEGLIETGANETMVRLMETILQEGPAPA